MPGDVCNPVARGHGAMRMQKMERNRQSDRRPANQQFL
jgi:hypothetical protein